jgi:hypothetical protein
MSGDRFKALQRRDRWQVTSIEHVRAFSDPDTAAGEQHE